MNVRIYHVADPKAGTERLIRASSPAQAVRHAASHMRANVAGQETIVDLLSRGANVETAGEQQDVEEA